MQNAAAVGVAFVDLQRQHAVAVAPLGDLEAEGDLEANRRFAQETLSAFVIADPRRPSVVHLSLAQKSTPGSQMAISGKTITMAIARIITAT